MNGERERLRAELRRKIASALPHLTSGNAARARLALHPLRGDHSLCVLLWRAHRIASAKLRAIEADDFIRASVPESFQHHAAALFPDPLALDIVDELMPPALFDEAGAALADFKGGFLFHGPTGSGKTRAAFRLLSRWRRSDEIAFRYYSGPVLKRQLADAARAGKAGQLIDSILGEDPDALLFIDDLSQARFTPSFAENLFELIDRVHRERRLLLVTVQTTGAALIRKWCADDRDLTDTAEAIARRLRDYCVKIRFKKSPVGAEEPS